MRGVRKTGLGLALGLFGPAAFAQDTALTPGIAPVSLQVTSTPAARLGRIQPLSGPATVGIVARGQAADPAAPPQPMPSGTQPPAGDSGLGMPRPLPSPNVTEIRGNPAAVPGLPPGATIGVPIPVGQPVVVGQPVIVSQGAPIGGPMMPSGAVPMPSVLPGGGCAGGTCPAPALDDPLFGGFGGGYGMTVPAPASRPRLDIYGEVLLGWIPNFSMPALLTTGSPLSNGIIGQRDTRVILQGDSLEDQFHTGGRFGFDYWFGCQKNWGFAGDFWFLGKNTGTFIADSNTYPVLARPFLNLNQNRQFSEIIAFPDFSVGTALVSTSSEAWGGGFEFLRNVNDGPCSNLNFLMGFRYMRLDESLGIQETFAREPGAATTPGVPVINRGVVFDSFDTVNEFYGANFGFKGEIRRGRFFMGGRAAIAVGEVFQTLDINGRQTVQYANGAVGTFPGGLLALPGANIGNFKRDRFAAMPEVGVKMGVYITPHLKFSVGYNLLYLSSVIRPGDQIDQGLDVTRIPNFPLLPAPAPLAYVRPQPTLKDTGLTTQWISLALQYDFY